MKEYAPFWEICVRSFKRKAKIKKKEGMEDTDAYSYTY